MKELNPKEENVLCRLNEGRYREKQRAVENEKEKSYILNQFKINTDDNTKLENIKIVMSKSTLNKLLRENIFIHNLKENKYYQGYGYSCCEKGQREGSINTYNDYEVITLESYGEGVGVISVEVFDNIYIKTNTNTDIFDDRDIILIIKGIYGGEQVSKSLDVLFYLKEMYELGIRCDATLYSKKVIEKYQIYSTTKGKLFEIEKSNN